MAVKRAQRAADGQPVRRKVLAKRLQRVGNARTRAVDQAKHRRVAPVQLGTVAVGVHRPNLFVAAAAAQAPHRNIAQQKVAFAHAETGKPAFYVFFDTGGRKIGAYDVQRGEQEREKRLGDDRLLDRNEGRNAVNGQHPRNQLALPVRRAHRNGDVAIAAAGAHPAQHLAADGLGLRERVGAGDDRQAVGRRVERGRRLAPEVRLQTAQRGGSGAAVVGQIHVGERPVGKGEPFGRRYIFGEYAAVVSVVRGKGDVGSPRSAGLARRESRAPVR